MMILNDDLEANEAKEVGSYSTEAKFVSRTHTEVI